MVDLASLYVFVVRGLADGIAVIVHWTVMQNNLLTVGVLALGLDLVYP
ncbi:MAG: hypothetical protein DI535_20005 [Citrobacter freundii]|nr:MAG: hypothetical protein DI535_20005 [Citrobacter freundii]